MTNFPSVFPPLPLFSSPPLLFQPPPGRQDRFPIPVMLDSPMGNALIYTSCRPCWCGPLPGRSTCIPFPTHLGRDEVMIRDDLVVIDP